MAYQNDRIKQIPAPLPVDYDRQTNFTDYQTANPGQPMQGAALDAEFNVIEQALDETQARQRLIQRDDGALQNGIVSRDSLAEEVIAGVNSPTTWSTGTVYAESDSVIVYDQPGATDPKWYVAEAGHTATVFTDDLAAGRWRLLVDLSALLADSGQTVVSSGTGSEELSDSLDNRWISKYTTDQLSSATALRAGNLVRTPGYYASGDGGGNDFIVEERDGSTEDGGSIIFIDGTLLQLRGLFPGDTANAMQFGSATKTFYVDNSAGIDTNPGTSANPVKTIQKAFDLLKSYGIYREGSWEVKVLQGTYTEGAVLQRSGIDNQILVYGEIDGSGNILTIIDGTTASNASGLNYNDGCNVRTSKIDVRNFSSSGILYQNVSKGVIDTCDASGNGFADFNVSDECVVDIVGKCDISVTSGAKGIRYYRQSSGSWGDPTTTITIDGGGNVADGIEIRDNSNVVAEDGVFVNNCQNVAALIRKHSYIEFRESTFSNNNVAWSPRDISLIHNATGVVTFTDNTRDFDYRGFSLDFNTPSNTVIGSSGRSGKTISSGYDLIIDNDTQTGIQFLTNSADPVNIDFNDIGRISYVFSDNSIRFTQNNVEIFRMRTDAIIPLVNNSKTLGLSSFRWANVFGVELNPGDGAVKWTSGAGSPEGTVTAVVGSMYTRTDGGAGTTLYVKESGTGNTGWVAK